MIARPALFVLATLAAAAPRLAAAEAGPPYRIDVTGGHTSLLAYWPDPDARDPIETDDLGIETHAEMTLHADHATFRQVLWTDWPIDIGLYAGQGEAQPGLSGIESSAIPALWSLGPVVPTLRPGSATGFLWTFYGGRADTARPVSWVVPYAGSNWGGVPPWDCNCGDPVNATLEHTRVTVRTGDLGLPGLSADVPLTVRNRSGAHVNVFDGRERIHRLKAGATWTTKTSGGLLTFSFLDDWTPDTPPRSGPEMGAWPTRLANACEAIGTGYVEDEFDDGKRRARCTVTRNGRQRTRIRRIPSAWIPPNDSEYDDWDTHLEQTGIMGDVLRHHVASPAPRTYDAWPALGETQRIEVDDTEWRLVDPKQVHIEVSSTLPGKDDRYAAANLTDGDPTTAWCEGVDGPGVGQTLTVRIDGVSRPVRVAVVPGYARSDWHFAANGVPTSWGGIPWRKDSAERAGWHLAPPSTADLYREGHAFDLIAGPTAGGVVGLSIGDVRPGTRFADTCVSEILVFVET